MPYEKDRRTVRCPVLYGQSGRPLFFAPELRGMLWRAAYPNLSA